LCFVCQACGVCSFFFCCLSRSLTLFSMFMFVTSSRVLAVLLSRWTSSSQWTERTMHA
jgi:hypothetical protein